MWGYILQHPSQWVYMWIGGLFVIFGSSPKELVMEGWESKNYLYLCHKLILKLSAIFNICVYLTQISPVTHITNNANQSSNTYLNEKRELILSLINLRDKWISWSEQNKSYNRNKYKWGIYLFVWVQPWCNNSTR